MDIKIKRTIDGVEHEFILTRDEIEEVRRRDKVEWAKNVLENYSDVVFCYDDAITDDEQLVAYADLLEEKNLSDNARYEYEAIEELFGVLKAS